jgi:hypothetical protein
MATRKGFEPLTYGLGIRLEAADKKRETADYWFANSSLSDIIVDVR